MFDRFYKADTARARSEGSGLGLAIASENAQLHGGHIEAGNHQDGGAVFTVSLPLNGDPTITGTAPQPMLAGRSPPPVVSLGDNEPAGQHYAAGRHRARAALRASGSPRAYQRRAWLPYEASRLPL